jgi:hypothetical protein
MLTASLVGKIAVKLFWARKTVYPGSTNRSSAFDKLIAEIPQIIANKFNLLDSANKINFNAQEDNLYRFFTDD